MASFWPALPSRFVLRTKPKSLLRCYAEADPAYETDIDSDFFKAEGFRDLLPAAFVTRSPFAEYSIAAPSYYCFLAETLPFEAESAGLLAGYPPAEAF